MNTYSIIRLKIKTVEDVQKRIELLQNIVSDISNEIDVWTANYYEYQLYQDVLDSIAAGEVENPIEVANEARLSRVIHFPRRMI
jgi:hypothetical protein